MLRTVTLGPLHECQNAVLYIWLAAKRTVHGLAARLDTSSESDATLCPASSRATESCWSFTCGAHTPYAVACCVMTKSCRRNCYYKSNPNLRLETLRHYCTCLNLSAACFRGCHVLTIDGNNSERQQLTFLSGEL